MHRKVAEGFRLVELPLLKKEAAFVKTLLQFLLEYDGFLNRASSGESIVHLKRFPDC